MKVPPARVDAFIKRPDPDCRCVLVYGPDRGLVIERAEALVGGVVEDLRDPFRTAELAAGDIRSDPARLSDEASALSLTGGRRVVRVREATDSLTAILETFLAASPGEALVVVDSGALGSRSSLRKLFEKAKNGAALACYGDEGQGLERVIAETLGRHGLSLSRDAFSYLVLRLGSDRAMTRSELEKLALYKGEPGIVELEDAVASVGDSAATSVDGVVHAAAGGRWLDLDRDLERAFHEGIAPVTILRAMARHMTRLHLATSLMATGRAPAQAMKALRPPVFFRFEDDFRRQLTMWPDHRIGTALELLTGAELDCKTTGQPASTLCGRALMRIAAMVRHPPMTRSA